MTGPSPASLYPVIDLELGMSAIAQDLHLSRSKEAKVVSFRIPHGNACGIRSKLLTLC